VAGDIRIDAAGALHHIICRCIERKKIFKDDIALNNFVVGQRFTDNNKKAEHISDPAFIVYVRRFFASNTHAGYIGYP
jgi:hypothetical protein